MPITQLSLSHESETFARAMRAEKVEPYNKLKNHPGAMLVTYYTGRVIALREMNGSDDSDFIAIVWTHEDKLAEITYATTRGWTYANSASVDATPEILAKYDAYLRHNKAIGLCNLRNSRKQERETIGLTYQEHKRLMGAYGSKSKAYESIVELLKVHRFRSAYRKSIASQVREWVKEKTPKYTAPLSFKQLNSIMINR